MVRAKSVRQALPRSTAGEPLHRHTPLGHVGAKNAKKKIKQEARRRGDRRRGRCLPERISFVLLSPQRLRASCSIFFPL